MNELGYILANISLKANEIGLPTSTTNLGAGFANITRILVFLAGALSVIFIVVGGLQLTTSGGSPQRVKTARETILYAAIGLALSLSAYAIVSYVAGSIK